MTVVFVAIYIGICKNDILSYQGMPLIAAKVVMKEREQLAYSVTFQEY